MIVRADEGRQNRPADFRNLPARTRRRSDCQAGKQAGRGQAGRHYRLTRPIDPACRARLARLSSIQDTSQRNTMTDFKDCERAAETKFAFDEEKALDRTSVV